LDIGCWTFDIHAVHRRVAYSITYCSDFHRVRVSFRANIKPVLRSGAESCLEGRSPAKQNGRGAQIWRGARFRRNRSRGSRLASELSPFDIRALARVMPQVVDNLLLTHTALMYMTVFIMVVDTQNMRAVRKYAFSVISRSFQRFSHLCSYR
jgi:hypothetical protein